MSTAASCFRVGAVLPTAGALEPGSADISRIDSMGVIPATARCENGQAKATAPARRPSR